MPAVPDPAPSIDPAAVARYLVARGWERVADGRWWETWVRGEFTLAVPVPSVGRDPPYPQDFRLMLRDLAESEGRTPEELVVDLAR